LELYYTFCVGPHFLLRLRLLMHRPAMYAVVVVAVGGGVGVGVGGIGVLRS